MTALSKLALGGPLLTGTIPPELGQLANLEQLTLAGSRLTGSVSPELGLLSQLYSLDLSGNQLTNLPSTSAWKILIAFMASHNHGATITSTWPSLLRHDHLDLSDNLLTTLPAYPKNLLGMPLYEPSLGLSLRGLRLTDLEADLERVAQWPHPLTHLDLSHNHFSEIPPVLSQLHPLLSLDLRGNPLTTCPLPLPWQIDRYIYSPDCDHSNSTTGT